MINNRQNGRRRGRGGGPRSPNNVPNPGNRQDNRQRGNAAQLHEKYRALARDAQLSGDRVQTENYLQFADHYYRVLNEGRARFEEQRRQRDDYTGEEGDEQENEAVAASSDADDRSDRDGNRDRDRDEVRGDQRDVRGDERDTREERDYRNGAEQQRPSYEPRDRQPREQANDEDEERISLDVLPPAIATEPTSDAPRPKRRPRRSRPDDSEEIAPAA